MTSPKILAAGGAHVDRRGRMTSDFVAGASIPGVMHEDVGGGAFNALRAAVRRGAQGSMLSMRGGDAAGDAVAKALAEAGVEDRSVVFLDRSTPSYTALLDRSGDVVAALADMQLYEIAFPKQMRRAKLRADIADADAILCDANIPAAGLQRLAQLGAGKPLFAIAISPAKAVRLAEVLPALRCLFMNRREASALAGGSPGDGMADIVERLRAKGLASGVVTQGNDAVVAFDAGKVMSLTPPAPPAVADVTGAGDAMAGAMTVALLGGMDLGAALRDGVAAALLAIASPTAAPAFSRQEFAKTLALVPHASEMR